METEVLLLLRLLLVIVSCSGRVELLGSSPHTVFEGDLRPVDGSSSACVLVLVTEVVELVGATVDVIPSFTLLLLLLLLRAIAPDVLGVVDLLL